MRNLLLKFVVFGFVILTAVFACGGQVPDGEAVVRSLPKVAYPREARETGLEGVVTVGVQVDERGKVTSVGEAAGPDWVCPNVSRPDVVAMREAAKAVAAKATFEPATKDGQAVASTAVVRVEFVNPKKKKPQVVGAQTGGVSDSGATMTNGSVPTSDIQTSVTRIVSGGVLNGKASNIGRPTYPTAARAVHASEAVRVQVLIDEDGKVFSAQPVYGHPLLTAAARVAACSSSFAPTLLSGRPVKVSGVITYNFVP